MTHPAMNRRQASAAVLGLSLFLLAACGTGARSGAVGGVELTQQVSSLDQAAYQPGTNRYVYGLDSFANIRIVDAPADVDSSRWAMLHDGSTNRLYFFRRGSNDTIYQFGFNPASTSYEYGYDSIAELGVVGGPPTRDPTSFAMLHDGVDYRLYMRDMSDPTLIHQWAFNRATGAYEYGYRSISTIRTTEAPPDADFSRWAMLHDGTTYRQYVAQKGNSDTLYQFGFDGREYRFGASSIPVLEVVDMPSDSDRGGFTVLHDGSAYRYYQQGR